MTHIPLPRPFPHTFGVCYAERPHRNVSCDLERQNDTCTCYSTLRLLLLRSTTRTGSRVKSGVVPALNSNNSYLRPPGTCRWKLMARRATCWMNINGDVSRSHSGSGNQICGNYKTNPREKPLGGCHRLTPWERDSGVCVPQVIRPVGNNLGRGGQDVWCRGCCGSSRVQMALQVCLSWRWGGLAVRSINCWSPSCRAPDSSYFLGPYRTRGWAPSDPGAVPD